MTIPQIKRGTTFRAQIELTPAEWAVLWPWDEVTGELRDARTRHALAVAIDADRHVISLSADSTAWAIGGAVFDLRIRRGGDVIAIPATHNIRLQIIEGASA